MVFEGGFGSFDVVMDLVEVAVDFSVNVVVVEAFIVFILVY